jgi:putative FmdB family regulatory protein
MGRGGFLIIKNKFKRKNIMALYEFSCENCAEIFEDIVPMGTKETECKKCGKKATKVMSVSHFRIEGYSEANGYSDKGKGKV